MSGRSIQGRAKVRGMLGDSVLVVRGYDPLDKPLGHPESPVIFVTAVDATAPEGRRAALAMLTIEQGQRLGREITRLSALAWRRARRAAKPRAKRRRRA